MSGKKLLVLGATGQTGQHVVKQALEKDHHVTALVRDPAKMEQVHDNLTVAQCDVFQREQIKPHVEKADVVMSCLGYGIQRGEPVPYFKQIAEVLSDTMMEAGKRRVFFMHSWFTNPESRGKCRGFFLRNFFIPYVLGPTLAGMRQCEEYLATTHDHLDYTVIQPAHLLSGPVTDKQFLYKDGDCCVPEASQDIDRADVARYMLSIINDEESFRKVRAIGTVE